MSNMVSVIIPIYNTEQYIKTCYLSVINQTYPNIEVFLINDASPDSSTSVVEELRKITNGRTIHYYQFSKNQGLSRVRNFGLAKSAGDYVAFLDSDDWYDSNYLTKMIDALEGKLADVAVCSMSTEQNNFSSSSIRYFYSTTTTITGDYALKLLSQAVRNDIYITPMVGNKVFRKCFLLDNKLSFLPDTCYEDDIFSFSLFASNPSVVLVSGTNQHYYQRETSITHSFSKKRIDDLINAFVVLRANLKQQESLHKYEKEYMSFFDRCITTTYHNLIETPISTHEKKQYIAYFLEQLLGEFPLKSIVEYLDIERFHHFMGFN